MRKGTTAFDRFRAGAVRQADRHATVVLPADAPVLAPAARLSFVPPAAAQALRADASFRRRATNRQRLALRKRPPLPRRAPAFSNGLVRGELSVGWRASLKDDLRRS